MWDELNFRSNVSSMETNANDGVLAKILEQTNLPTVSLGESDAALLLGDFFFVRNLLIMPGGTIH
jgi:hypothetical protein